MLKHKFKLVRGDDENFRLIFRNKDGSAVDLTGVRLDLHAIAEGNSEPDICLSSSTGDIDIHGNIAVLHFRHQHTKDAEWENANYDLQLLDANGKRKTLLYGTITLIHDCTQI